MIQVFFNAFWAQTLINGQSFLLDRLDVRSKGAIFCANLFYFLVLFESIQIFSPYSQFPRWDFLIESEEFFQPIWSIGWIKFIDWELGVKSILLSFLLCSFLAIVFWRRSRLIRILLFLSMFIYLSLISSFGGIEHWMHLMVLSSFLLIFIPNKIEDTSESRVNFLMIFFGIQAFILFTYFISGLFKFIGLVRQELAGYKSAFNPFSLAEYSAMNSYHHNTEYFLTQVVIDTSSILHSILLLSGFWVEFLSVYIIFRPSLHRTWGLLLVILHTVILLVIGPDFSIQILVLGVFLLFSPFSNNKDIIEDVLSFFKKKAKADSLADVDNLRLFSLNNCYFNNRIVSSLNKGHSDTSTIVREEITAKKSLLKEYPHLCGIVSFAIIETDNSNYKRVRINSDAITCLLSRSSSKYKPLRLIYFVSPFFTDLLYGLIIGITEWVKKFNGKH